MGPKLMQETNMEQLHSSGLAGLETFHISVLIIIHYNIGEGTPML